VIFLRRLLTTGALAKLNTWQDEQKRKMPENPNIGAIGGLYTYSFTPTSIGTVIKIKNNLTQDILDLSDYEDW